MRLKVLSAAVAAVSIAAIGCTPQSETTDTAAVSGNDALGSSTVQAPDGTEIKESLFRFYSLNVAQKPVEQLTPEERDAVLENLATYDLLTNAAESRGLTQERTVAVQLELQRQQTLARAMLNRYIEDNPPTDMELRAEYDANLDVLGAEHKASHILVESEQEAVDLIGQLDSGADFAELATEHSLDPSGTSNGGDLGWFTSDTMVAPFANAVETMEVGSYSSQPVQTQFGWHVILLEDRRVPSFDNMRAELSNRVTQRKMEAFIDSLKNE